MSSDYYNSASTPATPPTDAIYGASDALLEKFTYFTYLIQIYRICTWID